MRRARHPMPPALWSMKYNYISKLYEISENGIIYSMSLEKTRELKEGIKLSENVANWYADLSNEKKKEIILSGNIQKPESDFIPDKIPDDW